MQFYDETYRDTPAALHELAGFLSDCYAATGRPDTWLTGRLEDWRYGGNAQRAAQNPGFFREHAHLWRAADGRLLGFCIAEYGDDSVYLQAHPQQRWLEGVMLAWAETAWASGQPSLTTYAYTNDAPRRQLLEQRGYADDGESGRTYIYDLAGAGLAAALPAGFRIASLAEAPDVESHIAAVRSAFGRDTLNRTWFDTKITAPSYAAEWDLAVLSPEGEHVAFCLARLDSRIRVAELDPIGTRPEYQRRGLARALVAECLRRLHASGMRRACIGAGSEPAVGNRLYMSLSPDAVRQEHQWLKRLA